MTLAFVFLVVSSHAAAFADADASTTTNVSPTTADASAPSTNDAPATTNAPAVSDAPATTNAPATTDAPATTNAPTTTNAVPPTNAPPATTNAAATTEWPDITDELERASAGTIDACEVASLPLSIIPGVGDIVGTVAEWACLVPAALAVDTVAVHFGGRDDHVWQAVVAVLVQKLFEDLIDTPYDLLIGAATIGAIATLIGSALLAAFVIPGFPIFVPTLVAITVGVFLTAPVAALKRAGGDWVFHAVYFALTSRVYGDDLAKLKSSTVLQPGHVDGVERFFVLMSAAAGSEPDDEWSHMIPIAGPLMKAGDEAKTTKERMRRVGKDVLGEKTVGDDVRAKRFAAMDSTIDTIAYTKGATAAVGEGLAALGAGVGIAGAVMPSMHASNQTTGDIVGFTGLGIALAGLGLVAVSESLDSVKTIAVPLAYGDE